MDVEQKVKKTICDCLCIDSIDDNSIRLNDLSIDSLDLLDLDFRLDRQFDNKLLTNKLLTKMVLSGETTIQDVIDFVKVQIGSGDCSVV